jgi:hypothetical protein
MPWFAFAFFFLPLLSLLAFPPASAVAFDAAVIPEQEAR